jgi:hypothetical protein
MITVLLPFFLFIGLELRLLIEVGYWEKSFLKDFIFWIIFVTFMYLFKFNEFKEVGYFKKVIKDNLKVILLLEFISNSFAFSLTSELIIFPIVGFLALLLGVLEANIEDKLTISRYTTTKIKKGLYLLLNIYIIIVVIFSLRMAYLNIASVLTFSNFKLFFLPIILTILFLPFMYFLILKDSYKELFRRIDLFIEDKQKANQIKSFIFQKVRINLSKLISTSKKINYIKLKQHSNHGI